MSLQPQRGRLFDHEKGYNVLGETLKYLLALGMKKISNLRIVNTGTKELVASIPKVFELSICSLQPLLPTLKPSFQLWESCEAPVVMGAPAQTAVTTLLRVRKSFLPRRP